MKTVKVRNLILGDGIVKICVPVIAATYSELERSLEEVERSSCDLVEFRADFYFEEESRALDRIRETVGDRPVLYTLRTKEEGGEIEISDSDYEERILQAAQRADLVDIQLKRLHVQAGNRQLHSHLPSLVHAEGTGVILSWHSFESTPEKHEMVDLLCAMQREGCDIAKIAVMPHTRKDVLALMEASVEMLEHKAGCPFITMSMGNLGKVTRAACAFTGSCISFGTAGQMSAPGQIPSGRLKAILESLALAGDI